MADAQQQQLQEIRLRHAAEYSEAKEVEKRTSRLHALEVEKRKRGLYNSDDGLGWSSDSDGENPTPGEVEDDHAAAAAVDAVNDGGTTTAFQAANRDHSPEVEARGKNNGEGVDELEEQMIEAIDASLLAAAATARAKRRRTDSGGGRGRDGGSRGGGRGGDGSGGQGNGRRGGGKRRHR